MCNSIFSFFRQILGFKLKFYGRVVFRQEGPGAGEAEGYSLGSGHAPAMSLRGWEGLVFSGVCWMWVLQGKRDEEHSPGFLPWLFHAPLNSVSGLVAEKSCLPSVLLALVISFCVTERMERE